MASQARISWAHIFNTLPTGKTLNKAAQGGARFSFGGTDSADSNLDNKTPSGVRCSDTQGIGMLSCFFLIGLVHK